MYSWNETFCPKTNVDIPYFWKFANKNRKIRKIWLKKKISVWRATAGIVTWFNSLKFDIKKAFYHEKRNVKEFVAINQFLYL